MRTHHYTVVQKKIAQSLITVILQPFAVETHGFHKQDAQLSQRDRAAGCVIVFAKSRRLELGDNILQTL